MTEQDDDAPERTTTGSAATARTAMSDGGTAAGTTRAFVLTAGAVAIGLGVLVCLAAGHGWMLVREPSPFLWVCGVLLVGSGAGVLLVWLLRTRRSRHVRALDVALAVVVGGAVAVGGVWVPWQAAKPHAAGVLWSQRWVDDVRDAFPVGASLVVVGDSTAHVLDRTTGAETARVPVRGSGQGVVADAGGGHLVVTTTTGVALYSLPAGTRDWEVGAPADGGVLPVAAQDGSVVLLETSPSAAGNRVSRVRAVGTSGDELWARDASALSSRLGTDRVEPTQARGLPTVASLDLAGSTEIVDVRSGAVLETRSERESAPIGLAGDAVLWSTPDAGGDCTYSLSRRGVPTWQRDGGCTGRVAWIGMDRAVYRVDDETPDDAEEQQQVILQLADGSTSPVAPARVSDDPVGDRLGQVVSDDVVLDPTGGARLVATDPPATDWLWSVGGRPADLDHVGAPLGSGAAAVLTGVGGLNPWFSDDARDDRADVTVIDTATGEPTGHYGAGSVVGAYATGPAQALAVVEEPVRADGRRRAVEMRCRLVLLGRA